MTSNQSYKDYGWKDSNAPYSTKYLIDPILKVVKQLKPGSRILDVGCGNGAIAGIILSEGYSVVGIDLSQKGISCARETYPNGRFEVAECNENLLKTLNEEPFDLIISTEVIEHLYSPHTFLKACFGALKYQGIIACSTPYHGYLKNLTLSLLNKWDSHLDPFWDGGHIKFWSSKTLTRALRLAGFNNIKIEGAGRVPYLWKSMIGIGIKLAD